MPDSRKFNFTKPVLDALPLPTLGERLVVLDAKTKGLELRVTSSGVKTFSVIRRVKGAGVERVTIGRFPAVSIDRARREADVIVGRQAVGESTAEVRRKQRAELTFDALFSDYMTRHSKPTKRTWKDDEHIYENHLKGPLGGKKLSAIERNDVAQIHASRTRAGAVYRANRTVSLISSVFGWAAKVGLYDRNPASKMARNPEAKRERFLRPDELPAFFQAVAAEPNDVIRDYIVLSLLTGGRRANVQEMEWMELHLGDREWIVPAAKSKNGTEMRVHLSEEAVAILQARQEKRDGAKWVFPGKGVTGHLIEAKSGWRRLLERSWALRIVAVLGPLEGWHESDTDTAENIALSTPAQVPEIYRDAIKRHKLRVDEFRLSDLRIHDLRRTLGSWQAKTGASLVVIGKSLGHKNIATTAIYARLDEDPVRQSVNRATAAIIEAAGLTEKAEVVPIRKNKAR